MTSATRMRGILREYSAQALGSLSGLGLEFRPHVLGGGGGITLVEATGLGGTAQHPIGLPQPIERGGCVRSQAERVLIVRGGLGVAAQTDVGAPPRDVGDRERGLELDGLREALQGPGVIAGL